LADWDLCCKAKSELNLDNVHLTVERDDFMPGLGGYYAAHARSQTVDRIVEFSVPYAPLARGGGDTTASNSCLELSDTVIIRPVAPLETDPRRAKGRIISIINNRISASVSFIATQDPADLTNQMHVHCRVEFLPTDIVFRRQALALDNLVQRGPTDAIRQAILGQSVPRPFPVVLVDASYEFADVRFVATAMQTEAVNRALGQAFSLVQGPPDCGKTKVIAAMVVHMLKLCPGQKILVCATSNAAVQNLAAALVHDVSGAAKQLL
jgi:hypothetical protein